MATDNSPTRNGLILGIAAASVFTLGALKFVFDGYYSYMMEAEIARKALPPTELRAARADEQQRLTSGPMPIDKAMKDVGRERESIIQPEQSTDDGPRVGWSKLPHTVPSAPAPGAATPVAADGGANAAVGDAGASATMAAGGDAGANPTGSRDGGASPQDRLRGGGNAPNVTDAGGGKKP